MSESGVAAILIVASLACFAFAMRMSYVAGQRREEIRQHQYLRILRDVYQKEPE